MSFISTGFRELTLKVRRQRTRMALRREKRALKKAEIALGREGTSEATHFPEVRAEIVALKKLEQEQKEFAVRIAQIEEAVQQIDQQRQENSREQSAALAKLEETKRPLLEARNEANTAAENCGKELAALDRRIAENDTAEGRSLKKLSALQATEPPPADLQEQMDRIAAEREQLPKDKAQMVQARIETEEGCRNAREKLSAAESAVAQAEKKIASVRSEFESRDRALNESSRAQQEEVRQARQRHQTVEEKKDPAYLNIGRHLATAGIAPPSAPHLLTAVQRHREAVERHVAHTRELGEVSSQIDKQELRKFYFTIASLLVLIAIVVALASQSPSRRDWLPQKTSAMFSLNPQQFAKNPFAQRWQKEHPDVWQKVFAGLVGPAARIPSLDLARDASRVTRAVTMESGDQPRDYVLVETRGEIGPTLRAISEDKSFETSTVSGLAVWQRPDVSIARVGPRTLAVGSLGAVDQLVEVRLGTEPDLKVDDPMLQGFQNLDSDSTLRLVSRDPGDITRLFGPIFPHELLAASQLLGFAVTFDNAVKAHLFVRATDVAAAKTLVAALQKDPGPWLTLPRSDFALFTETPKVQQNRAEVDVRFEIPDGAARLLLQRLAKVQPAIAP